MKNGKWKMENENNSIATHCRAISLSASFAAATLFAASLPRMNAAAVKEIRGAIAAQRHQA